MGFWKNVEDRRNYLGMTRKELANLAGIKYAVIGAGLERDSVPAANTALKISKALQIPLENLLDDDFSSDENNAIFFHTMKDETLSKKYWNVYEDLECLSISTRQIITEMLHKLALNEKKQEAQ